MQKTSIVLAIAVMLFASTAMALPSIKLERWNPAYYATVLDLDGQANLGIYGLGDSFETYCLEANEYFRPGNTYYVEISESALMGGETVSDSLDDRTAYLYTMFLDETDTEFKNETDLQKAIHFIEDEGGADNYLVDLANTAVASGGDWYGMGLGDVRVLNLWNYADGTGWAQDQLIMTNGNDQSTTTETIPVPGAVLLGGIGIGFVGWLKRRRTL